MNLVVVKALHYLELKKLQLENKVLYLLLQMLLFESQQH